MLLVEALDTNVLSSSDHELMHLQMLWVELVQLFRNVFDNSGRLENPNNTVLDQRIVVDGYIENLLTCVSLTLQRLDYIQDVGKAVHYSQLMAQSFRCVLDDLLLVQTNDPYIVLLMSSIEDQALIWNNFRSTTFKEVNRDKGNPKRK